MEKKVILRQAISEHLDKHEQAIVRAVLLGKGGPMHSANYRIEEAANLWKCFVYPEGYDCCPFEFHFGRGSDYGHFNLIIGAGAGLDIWESFGKDSDSVRELAADVEKFLSSSISSVRCFCRGQMVSELFTLNEVVYNGVPVKLIYNSPDASPWKFWRSKRRESHSYPPWVVKD